MEKKSVVYLCKNEKKKSNHNNRIMYGNLLSPHIPPCRPRSQLHGGELTRIYVISIETSPLYHLQTLGKKKKTHCPISMCPIRNMVLPSSL